MRKVIQFMSRGAIKKLIASGVYRHDKKLAIISISDTPTEYDEMVNLLDGYTYTAAMFADDDDGMTPLQAKMILSFINTHADKDFYVHCFAGVSRSGAIAKFINEHLEAGEWYLEDYRGHNRKVLDQLRAAAGTSLSAYYEELEKQDRMMK